MMSIQLEQEQEEILSMLVEAYRNVPREQRKPFHVRTSDETYFVEVLHEGLPNGKAEIYQGDIETLARANLLTAKSNEWGIYCFDIIPQGFAFYKQIKQRDSQPLQRVETNLRSYLDSDRFRQQYSKAYQKWKDAETMLWDSDSDRQLTTIGHLCREAIQEFATSLVEYYKPPDVDPNKAHDIARLSAVLNSQSSLLGDREKVVVNALISYWRAVSGLIQRQEHGTQGQGHSLIWKDGHRVVFQTAVLMHEVDNSLSKTQ